MVAKFQTASPVSSDDHICKKDYLSSFWRETFLKAEKFKTSDIHIKQSKAAIKVIFRVNGELQEVSQFEKDKPMRLALTNRLKQIANADLSVQDETQSRSFSLELTNCRYRLEINSTIFGEYFVLRVIREDDVPSLKNCGLDEKTLNDLLSAIHNKQGCILFTGPTGSGKSTTMQACLMEIDREKKNVIALENPVERPLPGVSHTEITHKVSWKKAIKSAMRLDPDVILIGEIRDQESASLALEAAQTGHLVISTLHTNDVAGTIDRLCDKESGFGIERRLVAENLLFVAAQRLPQLLCPVCRKQSENPSFYHRGNGCETCLKGGKGTAGISGRRPVIEYTFKPDPSSILKFDKNNFSQTQLSASLYGEHEKLARKGEIDCDELANWANHKELS